MMSQSLDEIEEKNKQNLFRKLLANNSVIISKLADNFKKSLNNNEIYEIRKKILSYIKSKINVEDFFGDEDIFDENFFFYYIFQWKEFISNFYQNFR